MGQQFFRKAAERREGLVLPPASRQERMTDQPKTDNGAVTLTREQFEAMLSRIGSSGQAGFSPEALRDILTSVGQQNAQAMQKSLRPENDQHPGISVFNPKGERDNPNPKLKRESYQNGVRLDEERMTAQEIDLCNAFTGNREAHGGMWKATLLKMPNGSERLEIVTPSKSVDDRMGLPSFTQICRELLEGEAVANPDALAERVKALEQELAKYRKAS